MDRLDELAIFLAILDQGSLVGAARRLRRSGPAVSRALAALEDRLGVRLLERTTRRLAPTEAGRALASRARGLLGDYSATMQGVGAAPIRGPLRVTAPLQFGRRHVAPLVNGFLDLFPEITVELVLNDRNLDLIEEGIDVAVRIGPLADKTLVVRRVGEVHRIVVASPFYLASHGIPERPADLLAHDTILSTPWPGPPEWRFGPGRRGPVVRLAPRLLVNEAEVALLAARAGRGLARVLSYQAVDDLEAGSLVRVLFAFEPLPLPVHLVIPGGGRTIPKIRAFLDHAAAGLARLPVIRAAR